MWKEVWCYKSTCHLYVCWPQFSKVLKSTTLLISLLLWNLLWCRDLFTPNGNKNGLLITTLRRQRVNNKAQQLKYIIKVHIEVLSEPFKLLWLPHIPFKGRTHLQLCEIRKLLKFAWQFYFSFSISDIFKSCLSGSETQIEAWLSQSTLHFDL